MYGVTTKGLIVGLMLFGTIAISVGLCFFALIFASASDARKASKRLSIGSIISSVIGGHVILVFANMYPSRIYSNNGVLTLSIWLFIPLLVASFILWFVTRPPHK
jgi:hypothetical protein